MFEISPKYQPFGASLKKCNFTRTAVADSKLFHLIDLLTCIDFLYSNLKDERAEIQELNTRIEVSV